MAQLGCNAAVALQQWKGIGPAGLPNFTPVCSEPIFPGAHGDHSHRCSKVHMNIRRHQECSRHVVVDGA
jgi:hypothetical protein